MSADLIEEISGIAAYSIAADTSVDSPGTIGQRLLQLPEFRSLEEGEAKIVWMFRRDEVVRRQAMVLGDVHMPTVQGQLRGLFDWMLSEIVGGCPDYLVLIWREWWEKASAREREILCYHELSHMVQKLDRDGEPRFSEDGRPIWGLKEHDVNEFTAVMRRYGAYSDELRAFVRAASAHQQETAG